MKVKLLKKLRKKYSKEYSIIKQGKYYYLRRFSFMIIDNYACSTLEDATNLLREKVNGKIKEYIEDKRIHQTGKYYYPYG